MKTEATASNPCTFGSSHFVASLRPLSPPRSAATTQQKLGLAWGSVKRWVVSYHFGPVLEIAPFRKKKQKNDLVAWSRFPAHHHAGAPPDLYYFAESLIMSSSDEDAPAARRNGDDSSESEDSDDGLLFKYAKRKGDCSTAGRVAVRLSLWWFICH